MKKSKVKSILSIALMFTCATSAIAQEDTVFNAMNDELGRSMKSLKLKGHDGPYFMAYTIRDKNIVKITAAFGALSSKHVYRDRDLGVDLRVGNYDLDNSKYGGDAGIFGALLGAMGAHGNDITIDNDYKVLRQALWEETDSSYKDAIEKLEAKKAYLEQNIVKDRPADFTKEKPIEYTEKTVSEPCDVDKWTKQTRDLSAIFKDYPKLDQSVVMFGLDTVNRWLVNSEGTKTFSARPEYVIMVSASARTVDNFTVCDSETFVGRTESELPPLAEMEKKIRALGDRLTAQADAPLVEDYNGPVLFEGDAAAEFFGQTLGQNFGNPLEPLGGGLAALMGNTNPLKDKVGQRVMPTFVSVVDDPGAAEYKGTKLFGGMNVDHEGVKSQKLTLIDKGILKTFCSTRTPSRYVKESNGHARYGNASTTNLFVQGDTTLNKAQLYEKLRELGKQEGLKSVLVVRRLQNMLTVVLDPKSIFMGMVGQMTKRSGFKLLPASEVYQIDVETGKETLCRATSFNGVGLSTMRDIVALGDDSAAYPLILPTTAQGDALSIVTPSVLVKELDTQKSEKSTEKAPILPNPYFEEKKPIKTSAEK